MLLNNSKLIFNLISSMNDRAFLIRVWLNYNVHFYAILCSLSFRYIKYLNNFYINDFYYFIGLSIKFLEFLSSIMITSIIKNFA